MTDTPNADHIMGVATDISVMAKALIVAEAKDRVREGNDMLEAALLYNIVAVKLVGSALIALSETMDMTKERGHPNHPKWVALSKLMLNTLETFTDEPREEVAKRVKEAGK